MVNTRNAVGRYDMAVVLKAQVDNLTGRNEELRSELHEVRFEAAKAQENLNKANYKARFHLPPRNRFGRTNIVCWTVSDKLHVRDEQTKRQTQKTKNGHYRHVHLYVCLFVFCV